MAQRRSIRIGQELYIGYCSCCTQEDETQEDE